MKGRGRGRRAIQGPAVAVVERRGRFGVCEPLFQRGPRVTLERGSAKVKPGRMALVDFGRRGARALRDVGSPHRAREVAAAMLWEREAGRGFGPELEDEACDLARRTAAEPGSRRDLRELATFTVDPASARDFDDAVSARAEDDGIRLWIHIADVAAHVRPGGALEAEALRRGTSVYVPGTVEPMLPRPLSDEACSLNPGVDRLAVTAELELSGSGEPRSVAFYRSRVRSDARLDYDQLDEFFAGRKRPPERIADSLALARRAAAALAERRPGAALSVETHEPHFHFDSAGDVVRAHSVVQSESHRLIEQLMVLTNERVASLVEQKGLASLYRVHEQPDPQRIEALVAQLDSLDLPTPALPESFGPRQAGELVAEASRMVLREAERRGHGHAAYISLLLRSLKQAYYSPRNLGHAGLGSPAYTHFTSPIRRFPDLIAHRALLAATGEGEQEPGMDLVSEAGWHSSEREREAMAIERRADKVCASFLLQRELYEAGWEHRFQGEVSGLVGAGAFVTFSGELADVYEGFLPARLLRGERFDLDATETALVGGRTGRALRMGDPVDVRVDSVEAPRGRIDLVPVDGKGAAR